MSVGRSLAIEHLSTVRVAHICSKELYEKHKAHFVCLLSEFWPHCVALTDLELTGLGWSQT